MTVTEDLHDSQQMEVQQDHTDVKTLDQFELKKLQNILQKRSQVGNEIVDIKFLRRQADKREEKINEFLDAVDAEQEEYMKTLTEKYGKVSINPQTGELTDMQVQA